MSPSSFYRGMPEFSEECLSLQRQRNIYSQGIAAKQMYADSPVSSPGCRCARPSLLSGIPTRSWKTVVLAFPYKEGWLAWG